jgi:mannose-6-phosphate isomerase-like protein (cupin superfamily)
MTSLTFAVQRLAAALAESGELYEEFIRSDSLSVGLYRLAAGMSDPQEVHTEDEVYYIVAGRSRLRVADAVHDVEPGSVVFVARGVDHRFEDIVEDLEALVFFAPAEGDRA